MEIRLVYIGVLSVLVFSRTDYDPTLATCHYPEVLQCFVLFKTPITIKR